MAEIARKISSLKLCKIERDTSLVACANTWDYELNYDPNESWVIKLYHSSFGQHYTFMHDGSDWYTVSDRNHEFYSDILALLDYVVQKLVQGQLS